MPAWRSPNNFAIAGLVLSCYALYVEHKMAVQDESPPVDGEEGFSALCDIEQIGASCSSVFRLPEGRLLSYFGIVPDGSLLDVPNAAIGVAYYLFWLTLSATDVLDKRLVLLVSSLAMSASVFLAIQLLILKELCLLCWSTHVINARLLFRAYNEMRADAGQKKKVA